ncbi:MAG: transporter substrate-binding domain-containing protein [Muribaculaceae bacterium]|nr:transporter substrate-binding domain-containing protein [Muribaculaceae bacterium]
MKVSSLRRALPAVIIVFILVLSGIAVYRHFSTKSHLVEFFERPDGRDVLSVAIELSPQTYDPTDGDTIRGYDYALLSRIAREHSLDIVFHPYTNVEEALHGLDKGKYDIVVGDLTATTDLRERGYILTRDIYLDKQVLAQRVDTTSGRPSIDTQRKLGTADTIWVPSGDHYRRRLENLSAELGDSIHFLCAPGATSEHLAIAVAIGEIPYAVVSEEAAKKVAADYPNLDLSTPVSFSLFQTWAVAPGDSVLADSLNAWINELKLSDR